MGNSKSTSTEEHKTKDIEVIKEGPLDIQYGYKANVFSYYCVVNATELVIYTDKSLTTSVASIPIDSLLNIDVTNMVQGQTTPHYFQILFKDKQCPIVNIYCKSKQEKVSWVSVFESICPIALLTQELHTVKNCARNMGFEEDEIEVALIQYHNQYLTLYNVHEFIGFIVQNRSEKEPPEEKKSHTESSLVDLQCMICHQTYTNPVRNIHDNVYCLDCIKTWFDIIKDEQKQIRDPYTNKPLPQHCRLLITHFSLMVEVWNRSHSDNERIPQNMHAKLKKMDEKLDGQRKKLLEYLLQFQDVESHARKVADAMMQSPNMKLDKENLNELLAPSMECYECFIAIKRLIKDGCAFYNDAIQRIYGSATSKDHLFVWKEPKWSHFIDKNCVNWRDQYQVDEAQVSHIFSGVNTLMNDISTILTKEEDNFAAIKQEIIHLILQQQETAFARDEVEEMECNSHENGQFVFCDMERILYEEKHGLVNTRCVAEIANCIERKTPFELYHNDVKSKSMNRDQLVRFLETAGMDGLQSQYHIYKNLTLFLKNKVLQLSNYLKKTKRKDNASEFPYFRYVKRVDTIEPQMVDPKDWNESNDTIELRVSLDLDYDEHLKIYSKKELSKVLEKQIMKHLKLKCLEKHVQVTEIRKGSIEFKLAIGAPLVVFAASIAGGVLWFGYDIYKRFTGGPNYEVPFKNTLIQGMLVGGGIGGIIAMKCACAAALGVACGVLGGVMVGVALGYGIWTLLRRNNGSGNNIDPNGPGPGAGGGQPLILQNDDEKKCDFEDEEAPPGALMHFSTNIMDLSDRIAERGNNQYTFTLDCRCELEYDEENEQNEGNMVWCSKCKKETSLGEFKNTINGGDGIVATHSVRDYGKGFGSN